MEGTELMEDGWLVGLPLLRLKLMHITQVLELYRVLTITILNPRFASPLYINQAKPWAS